MNQKPRKFVGKMVLATMMTVVLAACSSGTGTGDDVTEVQTKSAMETYNVGDTFKATEPFNLSILYSD
ncbi:hypothetical protein [Paenibacillus sp. PCH8]|uniref:hypothetical protein n=1 Tax=Paenibacillus sp. PCH8 TaxID=2066524 RepID=UPI00215885EC|nr:hypothetical protein [Paenibacillus sp. PCH8]